MMCVLNFQFTHLPVHYVNVILQKYSDNDNSFYQQKLLMNDLFGELTAYLTNMITHKITKTYFG